MLYSPKILYRMARHGRYRGGWGQRTGHITRKHPDKPCIWIHAVSVGEVNATRTLVAALGEQLAGYEVVISATTDTGLARAQAIYGADHSVFYFPFDLSWVMARAFANLKPAVVLLMELEVWPNMAAIANSRNVPLVVVNGRLSDKSFPKYMKVRPLMARMFGRVTRVLAQTAEYADRFIALGCDAEPRSWQSRSTWGPSGCGWQGEPGRARKRWYWRHSAHSKRPVGWRTCDWRLYRVSRNGLMRSRRMCGTARSKTASRLMAGRQ
ncbi:MAG: 3-deoxy-D-manno-octulosonic acid transferase [Planctomycetota bacterium]